MRACVCDCMRMSVVLCAQQMYCKEDAWTAKPEGPPGVHHRVCLCVHMCVLACARAFLAVSKLPLETITIILMDPSFWILVPVGIMMHHSDPSENKLTDVWWASST
jgi:hypothetical protein